MMKKQIKYKCIQDPDNKLGILGKELTDYNWKKLALEWCTGNHNLAIRINLNALNGKDVLEYLGYIYKLKFEKVETYSI